MTKLHNNPHKWIIFRQAEGQSEVKGWEKRKLAHSGALTFVIAEHYDSTGSEPPEAGYRPSEYKSDTGDRTTHYRKGDWVVTKTDVFVPNIPLPSVFDEIVICQCIYDPIEPKWKAFGKGVVSFDSFGCEDIEAYYKFILSDEADSCEIRFDANTPLTEEEIQELKGKAKLTLDLVAI